MVNHFLFLKQLKIIHQYTYCIFSWSISFWQKPNINLFNSFKTL